MKVKCIKNMNAKYITYIKGDILDVKLVVLSNEDKYISLNNLVIPFNNNFFITLNEHRLNILESL